MQKLSGYNWFQSFFPKLSEGRKLTLMFRSKLIMKEVSVMMMVMLIEIENEGCFGGHFRETRSGCLLQQPLSIMMMHSDKFSHKKYTDNLHWGLGWVKGDK